MSPSERVQARDRIVLALDAPDCDTAFEILDEVRGSIGAVQIGLNFVMAVGLKEAARLASRVCTKLFLDFKLHDLPSAVAETVHMLCESRVDILTLHCAGGPAMLQAALQARDASSHKPLLLGIPLLAHLDFPQLVRMGLMEQLPPFAIEKHPDAKSRQINKLVRRLTKAGQECGLDGAVCSPHEIQGLRAYCGKGFKLMSADIHPLWAQIPGQRCLAPPDAIKRGCDYMLIGDAILHPPECIGGRAEAAKRILDEVTEALFPS